MSDSSSNTSGTTIFTKLPTAMLRVPLSPVAGHLYLTLASYTHAGDYSCFPAQEDVARRMGVSVRTVKRALRELTGTGLVQVSRQRAGRSRTNNTYLLPYQAAGKWLAVPDWLLDSGLSSRAVQAYATALSFADNDTRRCYPAQSTLAARMGVHVDTVRAALRELASVGAIVISQARRAWSHLKNTYLLPFVRAAAGAPGTGVRPAADTASTPGATSSTYPGATSSALTTTIVNYNHYPFTPSPNGEGLVSPSPDDDARQGQKHHPYSVEHDLTPAARKSLRGKLVRIGELMAAGHDFYDYEVQVHANAFENELALAAGRAGYGDGVELLHDKWAVSAACASPYEAGKRLNTLLATARKYAGTGYMCVAV